MELYAIEGNRQRLDGGAMFGNAPKALWQRWAEPDDENRIELATRALLVKNGSGKNILFEAGIGAFFEPKLQERYGVVEKKHRLLENLKKAGLEETDIDAVVLSHLHFDHAGGLLPAYGDEQPHLLFPNAAYYVSKKHWERTKKPHLREKASFIPLIRELLEKSERLELVETSSRKELGIPVSFDFVDGHTVGMMLSTFATKKGPLLFASDLVPGLAWMHIPITMGYDRYPEMLSDEKQAFLKKIAQERGYLFFTHDPKMACCKVVVDEKGRFTGEQTGLSELM